MNMISIFTIRRVKAGSIEHAGYVRMLFILYSLVCISCASTTVFAQTQLGSDIDGEVSQYASSYNVSLSADGDRLAIGARNHDGAA